MQWGLGNLTSHHQAFTLFQNHERGDGFAPMQRRDDIFLICRRVHTVDASIRRHQMNAARRWFSFMRRRRR